MSKKNPPYSLPNPRTVCVLLYTLNLYLWICAYTCTYIHISAVPQISVHTTNVLLCACVRTQEETVFALCLYTCTFTNQKSPNMFWLFFFLLLIPKLLFPLILTFNSIIILYHQKWHHLLFLCLSISLSFFFLFTFFFFSAADSDSNPPVHPWSLCGSFLLPACASWNLPTSKTTSTEHFTWTVS